MRRFTLKPPIASPIALVAATAKTVIYLKAGSQLSVDVDELSLEFDGTDPTKGAGLIEVIRFTTDCTVTSRTPASFDPIALANTSYCTGGTNSSSDGTAGDLLFGWAVNIAGGKHDILALMKELYVGKGERVGVRITAPFAVNVYPVIGWGE